MSNQNEVWANLSKIDVSGHVEKKDGLTYLSWAWAWGELKKHYPCANYEVKKNEDGLPYFKDCCGYICMVSLTVEGLTHEMWLPVMNHANKAMKEEAYKYLVWDKFKKAHKEKTVDAVSMFDVNKTIMRCLVKAIAMFGLGHYIYAGEDLPEKGDEHYDKLMNIIETGDALELRQLRMDVGDEYYNYLFNQFPMGEKTRLKAAVRDLERKFFEKLDELESSLITAIEAQDKVGINELSDIPSAAKKELMSRLNAEQIKNLKEVLSENTSI